MTFDLNSNEADSLDLLECIRHLREEALSKEQEIEKTGIFNLELADRVRQTSAHNSFWYIYTSVQEFLQGKYTRK